MTVMILKEPPPAEALGMVFNLLISEPPLDDDPKGRPDL